MGYNARLNPQIAAVNIGSVATDAVAAPALFAAAQAGQILNARLVNGNAATIASGTTAGSALNIYVCKNASDTAASAVASVACGAVAVLATATLTMSTSTSLTRFSAGDVYGAVVVGGAGNDNSTDGAVIEVSYMYGWARPDTATP